MWFTPLKSSYIVEFDDVSLINVYQSDEGKKNYYGVVRCNGCKEKLNEMNLFLQSNKPKTQKGYLPDISKNDILKIKFTTHYGKPKYKARKENGLPTVAEALQDRMKEDGDLRIKLKVNVDGYVYNMNEYHVVVQCLELYVLA